MPTCTSTRWLRRLAPVCALVGVLGKWAIQPLYKITIPCGTGLSRASLDTVCKVDTGFLPALFDGNVMARIVAQVDLARPRNFLLGVEEHLFPLGDPPGSARNREQD